MYQSITAAPPVDVRFSASGDDALLPRAGVRTWRRPQLVPQAAGEGPPERGRRQDVRASARVGAALSARQEHRTPVSTYVACSPRSSVYVMCDVKRMMF